MRALELTGVPPRRPSARARSDSIVGLRASRRHARRCADDRRRPACIAVSDGSSVVRGHGLQIPQQALAALRRSPRQGRGRTARSSPSLTALATVTGSVRNSQTVAAASTTATSAIAPNRLTPSSMSASHRRPLADAVDLASSSECRESADGLSEGLGREDDRLAEAEAGRDRRRWRRDRRRSASSAARDRGGAAATRVTSSTVTRSTVGTNCAK